MNLNLTIHPEVLFPFILILVRVSFIIAFLPIIGEVLVPTKVKALFIFVISMVLFPIAQIHIVRVPTTLLELAVACVPEFILGLSIGIVGRLIFAAAQFAGQLTGVEMGWAMANTLDPASNRQISINAEMHYIIALMIFFVLDVHHIFFKAIGESFRALPPLQFSLSENVALFISERMGKMFVLALKIAAPVTAMMIVIDIVLGLMTKAIPTMNVFIESFPIRIAVGLFVFMIAIAVIILLIVHAFEELDQTILRIFTFAR